MCVEVVDPLEELGRMGIVVCYASRMEHDLIWLPEDGLVVLNAQATHRRLGLAVAGLLSEIDERTGLHERRA
jgi:hypothetical protein